MAYKATMRMENQPRSGMALGGMGSGWFELRQNGRFYNWSIFNNEPYGTGPRLDERAVHTLFFMVRYQVKGELPRIKILQIPDRHDVGSLPSQLFSYPWMSGVERIEYEASFPFSRLKFTDPDMPLVIELEAFSPFIPHDVKHSSLPAAIFNFSIRSTSRKPVEVELLGTLQNLIGHDVARKRFTGRAETVPEGVLIEMGADLVDPTHDTWGTQCLMSLSGDSRYHLGWDHRHPFMETVIARADWPSEDAVASRNFGKDADTGEPLAAGCMKSTLAVTRTLPAGRKWDHTFLVAWHVPNRYAEGKTVPRRLEGYYYANHFNSAAAVGRYLAEQLPRVTEQTRRFHKAFFDSTAPAYVLDQVNSQLNTFLTSAWLTRDGNFGIQEGMTDDRHWGPLATIDVSLYGAIPITQLFPELDKGTLRAHAALMKANGEVGHGIVRNFTAEDHDAVHSRLDLPPQFVLLALRNAFWTDDKAFLKELWPFVKKALDYVLRERDANGDLLPDMGGAMCSYDNFPMYGAASFVASLWLAALAHAAEAAGILGDEPARTHYAECLEKGRTVFEAKLWNGKYYRLYNDAGGVRGDSDEGCLTDQLIGQWTMRLAGLGNLVDHRHVRTALNQVLKRNRRYWGLRNCTWPGDTFLQPISPSNWGDQGNTCWTGTELAFASFLIYEGLVEEGLEIIRDVDERVRRDGLYFDHQEFGGHYFRPMAAWAIPQALLGLEMGRGMMTFAPRVARNNCKLFFVTPDGYGQYRETARSISVNVLDGILRARRIRLLKPVGGKTGKASASVAGRSLTVVSEGAYWVVEIPEDLPLKEGTCLKLRMEGKRT